MKKNGFKLRMSSKWLICNGFYKGHVLTVSFMARGSVRPGSSAVGSKPRRRPMKSTIFALEIVML
jgi:hypothetical protein